MRHSVEPYSGAEATSFDRPASRVEIRERHAWRISGWFGVLIVAGCVTSAVLIAQSSAKNFTVVPIVVAVVILASLVIVQPGQTRVVRFFGSYVGTVRQTGLSWIVPFSDRRNVSVRVRNFETNHLKVNDADGNPVEIAAIVVWQVADTSRARSTPLRTTSILCACRLNRRCVMLRPRIPMTTPPTMKHRFVDRRTLSPGS